MSVPKQEYQSEFVPRRFAVIGAGLDKLSEPTDQTIGDNSSALFKKNSLPTNVKHELPSLSKPRHVPTSRVSRLANFTTLGIGLGVGMIAEATRRAVGVEQSNSHSSVILSEVN